MSDNYHNEYQKIISCWFSWLYIIELSSFKSRNTRDSYLNIVRTLGNAIIVICKVITLIILYILYKLYKFLISIVIELYRMFSFYCVKIYELKSRGNSLPCILSIDRIICCPLVSYSAIRWQMTQNRWRHRTFGSRAFLAVVLGSTFTR